jgi:nicotinamide mononucleotide adenylyltransferase
MGPIPRALMMSKRKRVVLVLDEFDKTRPSADALLLDVLQNSRVSLYIDNKKSVIYGNPRNLVIFITSNDFREFSEPLLRRLAVITLSHLPTSRVYQILSSRFNDTITRLLTQIYDDTIKAGLRKPATLQELYELGEILANDGLDIDLLALVKALVVKYEDDLEKYLDFIWRRDPEYIFKENKKTKEENIEKYYIPKEPIKIESEEERPAEKKLSIKDLLDTLKVDTKVNPVHIASEKTTVSFMARDDEGEMYSTIVKTLKPEPSEDPAVIGKFELWNVLDDPHITAKDPLKFSEVLELVNKDQLRFEAYVEDTLKITTAQIEKMLGNSAVKVRAYSKRLLRFEENNGDNTVLTELILDKDYAPRKTDLFNAKIKMYVKKVSNMIPKEVMWVIRGYIDYIAEYMKQGVLLDRDATVIAEVLKKYSFENENALWLLNVFKEDIELFKEVCRILKKVKIEKTEDKNKVTHYKFDMELDIFISRNHYNDFVALEEAIKEVSGNA